jgi:amino acid adenylation domain-containing protein
VTRATAYDELAASVLGPGIDPADLATNSFIGLGGDSILAMRLAAMAQERLGVRIPVASLLGEAPLASVLTAAAAAAELAGVGAGPEPGGDTGAPTRAQRGMWINEQVTGGSPYNLVFLCFVERGRLNPPALLEVLAAAAARNEGLRTVFRQQGGEVVRELLSAATPELVTASCDCPDDGFEEHARRVAADFGRRPFDVSAAPAIRFLLLTSPAGRQAVVLAAHHVILDGWAVGLLLREIVTRYDRLVRGAPEPAPRPGVPMRALLRQEEALRASGAWDRQAELWSRHLDGVPLVLELPSDRQRPRVHDPSGARSTVDLGRAVSVAVAERAAALGITPFAFLLGAFGLTLSRLTGARSLLVGVPVLGRGTSELADLIAYAGNLLPVRVDVDDDLTAADYLRSVHRSLLVSLDAGQLPFEELVARLGIERSASGHPLVQVCFGTHDQLVPERITTDSVRVRVEEGHGGGSQFDLSVLLGRKEPSLSGYVEYSTAVWTAAEAAGFVASFGAAAEQLAAAASRATLVEDVRCVPAGGRALLDRLNRTRRDFPASSLDELFRAAAGRRPSAVAVRDASHELTFTQLAAAAAEQARRLRAAGVTAGDRVLVAVERSTAEVVAVLGAVWAGAAYVGVDPSQPPAHLAAIAAKSTPAAAVARPGDAGRLEALGIPIVEPWTPDWPTDDRLADDRSTDGADAPVAAAPGRLAYVAFTSGSTGEPKGVAVPHRAVVRLVHGAPYVRLGPGERVLRLSPLGFDASTLELWGALLTGATLEVGPPGLLSPSELGAFLTERGVTVAWLTAGLFRLVEEFSPDSLGGLRQLLTGGDVLPHEHVARALRRHPGLVLTNGYGPTENTTFTTTHSVTRPEDVDGPLPIGTPVPGTRVYVLDQRARLLPPGAVGELYAGGEGLADGYLGDEAETARRFGYFSPDVPERLYRTGDMVRIDTRGRLRFLGRTDDQVKIRGYRVELSAISDALTTVPGVRDAVVTVTEGDSVDKRLLAAVIPAAGAEVVPAELRDHLSRRLPSYMVPALWAVVDRVPVTTNGKIDRHALAALAAPAVALAKDSRPAGDRALERVLPLFAEAIESTESTESTGSGRAELTGETDFFAAGGSSLAAVRLVGLVKDRLGVTLRLREFLLSPTPEGLSRLVEKAGSGAKAGVS